MNFSSESFINPLTSTSKNIHIKDINGIVKYIISPFNVIDIRISNNLINISLKSNKFISLDFSTTNESKLAIVMLQNQLDILRNNAPLFIDKAVEKYVLGLSYSSSSNTGDITFTDNIISTETEEDIIIQTNDSSYFTIRDNHDNENFRIAGTDSWVLYEQGDTIINGNISVRGAQYLNPYILDNGNFGWTYITQSTVVDSFSQQFRSVKYLVSCDMQSFEENAMTCEITLANSGNTPIGPVINVYGISSTNNFQFVTFSTRRKEGDVNLVELVASTTASNTYVTLMRQYIIYPND